MIKWLSSEAGLGDLNPHIVTALAIGLGTLTVVSCGWIITREKRKLQGLRNAEILLPGPRALFLRPYYSDTKIKFLNPFDSIFLTSLIGFPIDGGPLFPEQFVGRVLEPFVNVVQVGGNPATIGNATLTIPDKEWKAEVIKAVKAVSIIIILPVLGGRDKKTGHTSGESTLWELEHLVLSPSSEIRYTVVLMPNVILFGGKIRRGWEHARTRAAKFGLTLPPYDRKGAVLTFDQIGRTWQVSNTFGQGICGRRKIASGLVEAVKWLAERNSFALLDR